MRVSKSVMFFLSNIGFLMDKKLINAKSVLCCSHRKIHRYVAAPPQATASTSDHSCTNTDQPQPIPAQKGSLTSSSNINFTLFVHNNSCLSAPREVEKLSEFNVEYVFEHVRPHTLFYKKNYVFSSSTNCSLFSPTYTVQCTLYW